MTDLAIIGGGPAGYTAAAKAVKNGLSVVLFEKDNLGGVCLNQGCIPTKTLLYASKQYVYAQHADKYGVYAENVKYDWTKIQQRKTKVIRKLQAGIRAKLNYPLCSIVKGEALVTQYSEQEIVITCNEQTFQARNLLICTGSSNFVPPIQGIDSEYVIDSTQALNLAELPKSIIIIGGGVIGMEFATLYHQLGVEVTIIEALPQILNNLDLDVTTYLHEKYQKQGISINTNTKVVEIQDNNVICQISRDDKSEAETITLTADKILVCVGRRPNTQGLDVLPLKYDGRGIKIDTTCHTNLPNVYAAGDVTAKLMLAHVASRQAEIVVNEICCGSKQYIDYDEIPSVVYTNPEIATIGYANVNDDSLMTKQIPMTYSGRFVAENENENGICKILYDSYNIIRGAHLVGNVSSEIIALISMAISQKMSVDELERVVFPHPTISEIFKEVAEV